MTDRDPPVVVRVRPSDLEALRELASREGTTVSALLRRGLREVLRRARREREE